MRIFIIKPSGYTNEVEPDVNKEKAYTALARNHSSLEVNSRVNSRRQHGSVAIYTPTGNHCRVWGSKLIQNTPFNLWREYTRLFARVGLKTTRAAWAAYLDILSEYNNSNKDERWVVFFKELYPLFRTELLLSFFLLLHIREKHSIFMLYIIDGNRYYRLGFRYLRSLSECARCCNAHCQNFKLNIKMILNLTQHTATKDQQEAGVMDVHQEDKTTLSSALTFNSLPTQDDLKDHAKSVVSLAVKYGASSAMIGGAPYFMSTLERALMEVGINPVYAFSVRQSTEVQNADGSVTKAMVFKHLGFVGVE